VSKHFLAKEVALGTLISSSLQNEFNLALKFSHFGRSQPPPACILHKGLPNRNFCFGDAMTTSTDLQTAPLLKHMQDFLT